MRDLPKGLRLDKGYIQIRIFSEGMIHCENFGKDSPLARELATAALNEWRKKLLLWKAGLIEKHPFEKDVVITSKKFKDVADIFINLWAQEKTPEGELLHSPAAVVTCRGIIDRSLNPFFGKTAYDTIKPLDIQKWRDARIAEGISGTSANREQVVLSSIFSHIEDWVKLEKVARFKLPTDPETGKVWNPCSYVQKASYKKRERTLSDYEISKLFWAAKELDDAGAVENICLSLVTAMSLKDVKKLKLGDVVDLRRSKSGTEIALPITVWFSPDWRNWRRRFEAIRIKAGLEDIEYSKDIRKTSLNMLIGQGFDIKLISQYAAHANVQTTEGFYTKVRAEKLNPLAKALMERVNSLRPK